MQLVEGGVCQVLGPIPVSCQRARMQVVESHSHFVEGRHRSIRVRGGVHMRHGARGGHQAQRPEVRLVLLLLFSHLCYLRIRGADGKGDNEGVGDEYSEDAFEAAGLDVGGRLHHVSLRVSIGPGRSRGPRRWRPDRALL